MSEPLTSPEACGSGAEDDPGLDTQPVGGEGERRGVLLVVPGQLLRAHEPLQPG